MTITSFYYLLLVFGTVVIYYIVPKAGQWMCLLLASILFYFAAATPYTLVYVAISTIFAYLGTLYLESGKTAQNKRATYLALTGVLVNAFLWLVLKGSSFWIPVISLVGRIFPAMKDTGAISLIAALGMGYYTLQLIGYILDCYWGNCRPQKNIGKLFLFACYFPQMTSGPISRYSQLQDLYEKHAFCYENIAHGAQRILWGFLKKLVIAERAAIIVNEVWSDPGTYQGCYRWLVMLIFPIQMYADFSGAMDIVIGTSELFGIKLPENFNAPFFSRSLREFWQRWHITLGSWAKDYVLYPFLKSGFMVRLSKALKKKFGKKAGRFIATELGMLVLWTVLGLWHGAVKYVVGVNLWYWFVLMLSELCADRLKKLTSFFKINVRCIGWRMVQCFRIYIIFAVGSVFFRADSLAQGLEFFQGLPGVFAKGASGLSVFCVSFQEWTEGMGLAQKDIVIFLVAFALVLAADVLHEKAGSARAWVDRRALPLRWALWTALIFIVVIYGKYGMEYSSANFIYQAF
ncbi:MAG: hypothetical protein LUE16_06915 [Lachnospiraceae bacterium]|nr:hypothetical protein [Lachnospiraceae bacterium]